MNMELKEEMFCTLGPLRTNSPRKGSYMLQETELNTHSHTYTYICIHMYIYIYIYVYIYIYI